jgi:hypothetical protein
VAAAMAAVAAAATAAAAEEEDMAAVAADMAVEAAADTAAAAAVAAVAAVVSASEAPERTTGSGPGIGCNAAPDPRPAGAAAENVYPLSANDAADPPGKSPFRTRSPAGS